MSQPKTPLRTLIRAALDNVNKTQAELANDLGISAPELSDYVRSKRVAPDELLVRIAELLDLPPAKVLLTGSAARCEKESQHPGDPEKKRLRQASDLYLELAETIGPITQPVARTRTEDFVTLQDFPDIGDRSWCVITGDRREDPPQGQGDIFALSASSSDLMFLFALGLPRDTVIRSDKIFKVADEESLKKILHSNLLVVGSPAVSFATREILRRCGATFWFNISRFDYEHEATIYKGIPADCQVNGDFLAKFVAQENTRGDIDDVLATFRKPGFVDPIDFKDIRGRSIPRNEDYAVIALAPNPWSAEHFVCVCAGVHGPGTAGAMRLLSLPDEFAERPWGGILTVTVSDQAHWEDRFRYLNPKWETHKYSPSKYIEGLKKIRARLTKRPSPQRIAISNEQLDLILRFVTSRLSRRTGEESGDATPDGISGSPSPSDTP